jgi:hypothetical protein
VTGVLLRLNIAIKITLVALLLHAVVFPDLPQYDGKGIGPRLALYPVSIWLVPLVWWLVWRRRGRELRYPHLIDICVALPFTIDTAGNAANLYDTIDWWDDVMHFVTWVPWVIAFGLAIRERSHLRRVDVAMITIGFGAATHIVWEVLEYLAFIRNNPNELAGAYTDTIGDLVMSLSGSITGGVLVGTVLFGVGRLRPSPQTR